jgi:DNA ligase 1
MMNPQLAKDAVEEKLRYPLILMPKIDGVRGLNLGGQLYARSMKKFPNPHTSQLFSGLQYLGRDGELTLGPSPTAERLCSLTTGAVTSHTGQPDMHWWLFDQVDAQTLELPYIVRLRHLAERTVLMPNIHLVPWHWVSNQDEMLEAEESYLDREYEGIILRSPNGLVKSGRSTAAGQEYMRVKRFIEEEAVVLSLTEGSKNNNEQTTNELGRSTRSSHAENKEANGMVGSMECRLLKDISYRGKKLLSKDQIITVSAGCMSHDERLDYFKNQHKIIGQVIKFKFFPIGIKDKPRMPGFVSLRPLVDR